MPASTAIRIALAAASALAVLAVLRLKPWQPGADDTRERVTVGYLPVTCHLTCPVTDYASRSSRTTRFESQRFSDFPTVVEALRTGRLEATFLIVPLAMKLREQGVPVKVVYLGHRDGSTLMVAAGNPATGVEGLRGRVIAVPSKYSNQYLVLRRLLRDRGVDHHEVQFVEMPPPDMPTALAAGAIDGYFVGEPHAAKAEVDGTGRVLHHAKDVWPGFVSCVLVVHESLIARPHVVRDLVRGIAESGEWAERHREGAARLAAPYFRQDEKLLRFVLTQPPGRVSYRTLTPSKAELQQIMDTAVEAGILRRSFPVADLLDTSFIPPRVDPAPLPRSAGDPPPEDRE